MRTKETAGLLICALVWAALAAAPARSASSAGSAGGDAAPGVARLSVIASGSVVLTSGDGKTQIVGTVNAPLMPGDAFAVTGANARAEIQLDGFSSLRLGGGADGRIVANDAHARQIRSVGGLVELSVLRGGTATEIDTPTVTLRTHYAGAYRIAVDADGTTAVTARSGQLDAIGPHRTYALVAGQTLEASGPAGDPVIVLKAAVARDAFDDFNADRDRALLGALDGDTHIPASIAGYNDLNAYGTWTSLASYGAVWFPQQSTGWAPYSDGQWSDWGNEYGSTWVGNEPWGWVPYHYGRWIYAGRRGWCWYPPRLGIVPPWAPGLVGFFGYGPGLFGYSGFGWVPLGPNEAYYPWYRSHPRVEAAPAWKAEFERAASVLAAPTERMTMPIERSTMPVGRARPIGRMTPIERGTAPIIRERAGPPHDSSRPPA
jgi:hypothetical protein